MADDKIRYTQEGYDLLMDELATRKQQTRVEIAKRIEDEMDYPGQIKVNLIRESRAVEYAK